MFSEVHKAVRRSTKEFVALKKIRMEVCDKEGRWERTDFPFTAVREIKLLKQLKHPNIISVIDMAVEAFGTHQNDKPEIYLVFPYMEGDLCGILDDPRVILDMGTIKAYMQQLLDGLHYLHYNNIIHRDLKSANILLNNRGELRIADFGLARQFEPVRRPEMTAVVVTRWYRAPELLLGIRRYTVAIDMWAFGCILAEMITRKPLFPGQDHTAGKDEVTGEIGQLKLIYEFCGAPTDPDLDEIMQGERELRSAAKMVDRVPYFSSRSLIQHLRSEFVKSYALVSR
ncbi:kinase-like domain-containing protein [Catenaria anguillulae PL171]|uniref:Kinase-like domain-containing protein n=1 Tax=Catenaria anguillulae PL171 TaxID=765915 RepID=A0A1Y2HSI1_9FUNG|nr:kinase-like domain-containing protein [Catenaria anguillulae PL171]